MFHLVHKSSNNPFFLVYLKCGMCGKGYINTKSLKYHELYYCRPKCTYKCPIPGCQQKSPLKANMKRHIMGFHKNIGEAEKALYVELLSSRVINNYWIHLYSDYYIIKHNINIDVLFYWLPIWVTVSWLLRIYFVIFSFC